MATIEEDVAKRLWVRSELEWIGCLYTPFVICLASGNLKLHTFRHYIAQDVHFLTCFAQAYELAEECADDDDAKVSISELRQSVLQELEMHCSFCQEWGFDVSKETLPNSATIKYTDFLLATASGKNEALKSPENITTPFEKKKVAAYTICAMAPCMRLYAFIGKKLQSLLDVNGNCHPYKKWIDNYSCEAFQAAALQTDNLLDKLSVTLVSEELDIMQKLYLQAMKLEKEFFLAQPVDQQTIVPLSKEHNCVTIFSGFDLNCTVVDSCTVFADIAMATSPNSGQAQPESLTQPESQSEITKMPLIKLRKTWEALDKQYAEEYEHLMDNMLVNQKAEKFDYEGLRKVLALNNVLKEDYRCDQTNITIFIGDSIGDLLCLVEADIGIVIGSSSSLEKIGGHFGVTFIPLWLGLVLKQKEHVQGSGFSWNKKSGVVCTVSSWAEIRSLIVGY